MRRRGCRMAVAAVALVSLLVGCGGSGRGDIGSSTSCPHRNAYCPAAGTGVAFPGRQADSPSGRFRLGVRPASSADAAGDWRFEVVDKATGSIVLGPSPALDGGLGLVVAWDERPGDTLWVSRPEVVRWRPGADLAGPWVRERPGPGDVIPAVVTETVASDAG